MYAKLKDGKLTEINPKKISYQGRTVFNPSPETLVQAGWKPVIYTDAPVTEGYSASPYWTETDTQIVQEWEQTELPKEQPLSAEEFMNIVLGGE